MNLELRREGNLVFLAHLIRGLGDGGVGGKDGSQ